MRRLVDQGPALALAGRFAAQGRQPATAGSLPDDIISFGVLVLATVIIVGGLNFFPALALGPVVEALQR
jgi:K+-transporting ATPase ATPase A chain